MIRRFRRPARENSKNTEPIVIKYLPIVGPLLIFIGVMRLYFYYKSFHVNILYFLEFSEIITSIFDLLMPIIIFYTLGIIQSYLLTDKEESKTNSEIYQEMKKTEHVFQRINLHFRLLRDALPTLVLMIITFGGLAIYKRLYLGIFTTITLMCVFMTIHAILRAEANLKHERSQASKPLRQYLNVLFIGWYFGIIIYANTKLEVDGVKNFKSNYGTKLVFDNDSTFISDSARYFIGKTANYIFIYDEKKDLTDVLPSSKVKQFQFPKAQKNKD